VSASTREKSQRGSVVLRERAVDYDRLARTALRSGNWQKAETYTEMSGTFKRRARAARQQEKRWERSPDSVSTWPEVTYVF
jgi:hypothetical protein